MDRPFFEKAGSLSGEHCLAVVYTSRSLSEAPLSQLPLQPESPCKSFEQKADVALLVPAGSSSRGGDVAVYVCDTNQPSLPTPFNSVLTSVSVFMALSTVFHSTNSPNTFLLSHSALLVFILPYGSYQLYLSLCESLLQP